MSHIPAGKKRPEAPFQSVETVSTEIFDRLVEIDRVEDLTPEQTVTTKSRLQKLGEYLLDAAPKMGTDDAVSISESQPEFDFALMVEGDEGDYFGMSRAAGERQKEKRKQTLAECEAERVSYHAARKRSSLPEGIELLEGRGARYSEDDILSAVKGLMVESKQEERTRRSEHQPKHRQRTQPAPPRPVLTVVEPVEPQPHEPEPQQRLHDLYRARLAKFFLKDTVLAISLSIWAALMSMAFIDPSVTHLLVGVCLYLIFVYALAYRQSSLLMPIPLLGRRTARNMGGHAGA